MILGKNSLKVLVLRYELRLEKKGLLKIVFIENCCLVTVRQLELVCKFII